MAHQDTDPPIVRLRDLSQVPPDLREAFEAILPLLRDVDLAPAPLALSKDDARRKLEQGQPLLAGLDLELDCAALKELVLKMAGALEPSSAKAGRIRQVLEQDRLDIGALLPRVAARETDAVDAAARSLELDPGLLRTIISNALKPALRAWCRQAASLTDCVAWNKSSCFVCGATASLAELQGNEQTRHARCGSCGADWQVPRLQCLFCGNDDHRTQRYFTTEDGPGAHCVEACDKCRGYLKVINAFDPTPPELLQLEDLATLHLDYIAREQGYRRPDEASGPDQ